MLSSRADGFSLPELLVSIAILGLLAAGSWVTLTRAKYRDDLYNASRVLSSDLRSAQASALNSTNVKFCNTGVPLDIVCEASIVGCATPCSPQTPATVGIQLVTGNASYDLYAQNDVSGGDLRGRIPADRISTRNFSDSGAPNVTIQGFTATPMAALVSPMNVAFQRQNGNMRINVCPACTAANELTITLVHAITGKTALVKMNSITGRIHTEL